MPVKLNIGAGSTKLEGFTPIDRRFGTEAFPLSYDDNSVDEIRASHILEHFSFGDAIKALEDWVRVLKPGGRIRLAVPDVDKALATDNPERLFWLMGGQSDENDFHRSAYDRGRLQAMMKAVGLADIKPWESPNTDTASHPCSLNLEGRKPDIDEAVDLKIGAFMTLPRYEAVASRGVIQNALHKLGIPLTTSQGVYYGQCMQRMFEDAVKNDVDWILTLDSDSLFTAEQLSQLLDHLANNAHIDALAALQCRRGKPFPLMTQGHNQNIETTGEPILVTTAHFGLTLIRVDSLRQVQKPWFFSQPEPDGTWGDGRLDDDIWFWHQWRLAGLNVYVDPLVSIGHLEEMVAGFDDELQPRHEYLHEWRIRHGLQESDS